MGRDRFKEQKEYDDLILLNTKEDVERIKSEINKILPRDLKIKAMNDSQINLIKSIKSNEITICAGPAGTGKAQPLDSLILSENGFIKMGDIKMGDMVYSMSGNLSEVIGVFPQGKKKTYEIMFSDNSVVECCDEHLWLSKSSRDRENKKDFQVRRLVDMKDDFLLKRDGRKNYSIPITKPINFNERKIDIDPYLMGVLIGDGCFVAPNIMLTTIDDEIITSFNNLLSEEYQLSKAKSDGISYNIVFKNISDSKNRFNDKLIPFTRLISKYNLLGIKSDLKFIPNDYKFNSIENRIKLLQGLMDSDGTIERKSRSFVFSTSSLKLIEDFRFLVESLGGVVNKLRTKKGKYKKNNKLIDCKNSYSYSFRLPNNINPFLLKRKSEQVKLKSKYFPIRYIKDIKYVGEKESQCIMVDDISHTYLTNNLIVTHNTFVAMGIALNLLKKSTNRFKKIYLVKSVKTLKDEEVGFLPGDIREKIEPAMWSFYLNMEKVMTDVALKQLVEKDIVRPAPLAFIRGASLDDCIIIADEMQNVTLDNSRTLLTRIGSNAKIILLGDINQVDMRNKTDSSLETLLDMFNDVENMGVIKMSDEDTNIRNPLITIIEKKYKEHIETNNNGNGRKKQQLNG